MAQDINYSINGFMNTIPILLAGGPLLPYSTVQQQHWNGISDSEAVYMHRRELTMKINKVYIGWTPHHYPPSTVAGTMSVGGNTKVRVGGMEQRMDRM